MPSVRNVPQQITADGANEVLLTSVNGDTLYYGSPNVSATNNVGSVAVGQSVTFTRTMWVVSASETDYTTAPTQTSPGAPDYSQVPPGQLMNVGDEVSFNGVLYRRSVQGAISGTFNPRHWAPVHDGPRVQTLPVPFFLPHRGGRMTLFEHMLEFGDAAQESSVPMLYDSDMRRLGDGTFVFMHDTTVDRTTTGTGATTKFGIQNFRTLSINATDANTELGCFGFTSGMARPAIVSEWFERYGGKVPCNLDVTPFVSTFNTDVAALVALIQEYRVQPFVTISGLGTVANINALRALDPSIPLFIGANQFTALGGTLSIADAQNLGVVAVSHDWGGDASSQALCAQLKAAGIRPIATFCSRISKLATWLALGVEGCWNEGLGGYLHPSAPIRKSDAFVTGMSFDGWFDPANDDTPGSSGSESSSWRGQLQSPGVLNMGTGHTSLDTAMLGFCSPMGGFTYDAQPPSKLTPASGSVQVDMTFVSVGTATGQGAGIRLCNDDGLWSNKTIPNSGYVARVIPNGGHNIARTQTNGTDTGTVTASGWPTVTAGDVWRVKLSWTATALTFTLVSINGVADGRVITLNDTTFVPRPPYVMLLRNNTGGNGPSVNFSNVVVT